MTDRGVEPLTKSFMQLSNIESLLGINGIKRVIGMLGQDDRKRTYLEDLTSRIYLELSEAVRVCIL